MARRRIHLALAAVTAVVLSSCKRDAVVNERLDGTFFGDGTGYSWRVTYWQDSESVRLAIIVADNYRVQSVTWPAAESKDFVVEFADRSTCEETTHRFVEGAQVLVTRTGKRESLDDFATIEGGNLMFSETNHGLLQRVKSDYEAREQVGEQD